MATAAVKTRKASTKSKNGTEPTPIVKDAPAERPKIAELERNLALALGRLARSPSDEVLKTSHADANLAIILAREKQRQDAEISALSNLKSSTNKIENLLKDALSSFNEHYQLITDVENLRAELEITELKQSKALRKSEMLHDTALKLQDDIPSTEWERLEGLYRRVNRGYVWTITQRANARAARQLSIQGLI